MNILLLHTNEDLIADLKYSFQMDGSFVFVVHQLLGGIAQLDQQEIDLILLGNQLEDADQLEAIRQIRTTRDLPIIVLAERASSKDAILSLEYGADDYMPVPLNPLELKARIRSIERNRKQTDDQTGYEEKIGPLSFHFISHLISCGEISVALSEREFQLLFYLAKHANRIVPREELAGEIWPDSFRTHLRTVDVYVRRIREKLEAMGLSQLVETRWKEGYTFQQMEQ